MISTIETKKYSFTKYGINSNNFTVTYKDTGTTFDFKKVDIEFIGIDSKVGNSLAILTGPNVMKLKKGISDSLDFISFTIEPENLIRVMILLTTKGKK